MTTLPQGAIPFGEVARECRTIRRYGVAPTRVAGPPSPVRTTWKIAFSPEGALVSLAEVDDSRAAEAT